MASFAEIKSDNNEVLRIVVINNADVDANGGELSTQAETWVADNIPQCEDIKKRFSGTYPSTYWKQCSHSNSFRNEYPDHPGSTYDPENDVFIYPQFYPSWVLDENFKWRAPVTRPEDYRDQIDANGESYKLKLGWDEDNLRWISIDRLNPRNWIYWDPNNNEWVKTGETYDG